jgi:pSer/pThr/pTyr-binding forkhead associated (FHA) protein
MTDAALILPDGREVRLRGDSFVGRDEVNQIQIENSTVSRRHALLVERDNKWWIADSGSYNGTFLNDRRLPPGVALQLRHTDRIRVGSEVLVFSAPALLDDPDRTETHEHQLPQSAVAQLSSLQLQVVRCLCTPWLEGASLDELPSNEQIAAELGTPGSAATVKAALRRAYSKAGLTEGSPHAKRRALCRVARQRGWV